jgi:hypothetical protein
MRAPVSAPAGDCLLKEEPGGIASVLAEEEEGLGFARGAALREHKMGKEDEVDSAFHSLRDFTEGHPQFVEVFRGDH